MSELTMGKQSIDLTGNTYGRLTVIRFDGKISKENAWLCLCTCGKERRVQGNNLKSGHVRSCGCLKIEVAGKQSITHGLTGTTTYSTWSDIKQRCTLKHHPKYKWYGARGINICDDWFYSFQKFIDDMGERPTGLELDRVDNSKGYYKENCRWTTRTNNMRNTRYNVISEYNGKMLCISELAELINVPYQNMKRRISDWGMNAYEAIESAKKARKKGVNKRKANKDIRCGNQILPKDVVAP